MRGERGWVQEAGENSENSQTPRFGLPEDPRRHVQTETGLCSVIEVE